MRRVSRSLVVGLMLALAGPVASAAPPGGEPAAAPGAAVPGALVVDGIERTYRVYVPPALDRSRPAPLLLALHGGGGTGVGMERLTRGGLNRLADRDGFIAVYPDGVERHWNDGRGIQTYRAQRENIDDVGFISALIEHLAGRLPIDRSRVYSTGISNGGQMSFRLARELTSAIAAIAPVATSMSEQIAAMRPPSRPISVLMIAGTQDPLVPWEGGDIGFAGGAKVGKALAVVETIRYWARFNQCPSPPAVAMEPDRDPNDGTRVRREAYGPCRDGTDVVLLAVEGGGHTWPGGWQYLPERIIGRTSRDIDANEVIWSFFRRHVTR